MKKAIAVPRPRAPGRALALAAAVFAVPLVAHLVSPSPFHSYAPLLWLLALAPAFPMAYEAGRRGALLGLAVALATLIAAHAFTTALGWAPADWSAVAGIAVLFLAATAPLAWLTERMHRDRLAAVRQALARKDAEPEPDAVLEPPSPTEPLRDPLTGLLSRRHLNVVLETEFAASRRGRQITLALVELDRFDDYTGRRGREAADSLLVETANALTKASRGMDVIARIEDDRFAVLLSDCDEAGARAFAARFRDAMARLSAPDEPVTASLGLAVIDDVIESPEKLLDSAGRALSMAKFHGGDRVEVFSRRRTMLA